MRSTDEWIATHDDQAIPPRVQLRIFGRDSGRCKLCTRKVGVGGETFQLDHRIALVNGGSHSESNLQVVCTECHKVKTRQDVAEKSKVARVRKRQAGIKRPRTIRAWRKFNGEIVHASRNR